MHCFPRDRAALHWNSLCQGDSGVLHDFGATVESNHLEADPKNQVLARMWMRLYDSLLPIRLV